MFDGEGVDNCQVELFDATSRRSVGAMVDDLGKFEMKEVPFGDYQVAVHQMLDPHAAGDTAVDPRIPKDYRSPDTSGLTVSIKAEPIVLDIEMK